MLFWLAWYASELHYLDLAVCSFPRIFSLFRKRTEEEQRYYEVPAAQRWVMAGMYFGLIAALVVLMYIAQIQLQSLPHPRHQAREQIV